jgi:hypothetical protein
LERSLKAEEFHKYQHEAVHTLMDSNAHCEEVFRIGLWERWQYELDAGALVFAQDGFAKVIASIQVVGTTAKSSKDWLWAWANQSFDSSQTARLQEVRSWGEREGLRQFTEESWPDDEYLGWEMTAVTARILDAKGAYRCPDEKGVLYLVYTDIRKAEENQTVAEAFLNEKQRRVDCGDHGKGFSTYLCKHLLAKPRQEWFSETPSKEKPWPDAWCAKCDEAFQEQREWNEANEKIPEIKLVCDRCYETLRSKRIDD